MSDTPEVDAVEDDSELYDLARTLERQRNELARHLRAVLKIVTPFNAEDVDVLVSARIALIQIGANK